MASVEQQLQFHLKLMMLSGYIRSSRIYCSDASFIFIHWAVGSDMFNGLSWGSTLAHWGVLDFSICALNICIYHGWFEFS